MKKQCLINQIIMKNFFIVLLFAFFAKSNAQTDSLMVIPQPDIVSLGLGAGFDYGGFGGNLLFYPQPNFGLFAGAGYAIADFGYNVGAKVRFSSKEKFRSFIPYITGMYGYHAAIKVTNASEYDKMFYGPTFGAGFDYVGWPGKRGYWSFAILVPIRGSEVQDYIDDLENMGVEFKSKLIPIGISIGYRFVLN